MNQQSIHAEVDRLGREMPWYHDVALPFGVRTGGWKGIAHLWENIRNVRAAVAPGYVGASVLDLGSWDGGWAFEAEDLGAARVVAFESGIRGRLEHFMFCRQQRNSAVIPMYGADAERADVFLGPYLFEYGKFDIVQHLGLLYHLKNPMASLEAARRVIKPHGVLLLETAGDRDTRSIMRSNDNSAIYRDAWTFWAPSLGCLTYMLEQSGFRARPASVSVVEDDIPRICLIADPI